MALVDLLLGDSGPYTPPPGSAVHLVLGGLTPTLPMLHGQPLRAPWGRISLVAAGSAAAPFGRISTAAAGAPVCPWGPAAPLPGPPVRAPWGDTTQPVAGQAVAPWGPAGRTQRATHAPWGRPDLAARITRAPWGRATLLARILAAPWQRAQRAQRATVAPWGAAAPAQRPLRAPWGTARLVIWPGTPPLPTGPWGTGPASGTPVHLRLCKPAWTTDLVLGADPCPPGPRALRGVIEPAATYMQVHSIAFHRLPDEQPLHVWQWSLSADADSFGWTLQFTGPADLLVQLAPIEGEPAQVRLLLDGMEWQFVVRRRRRNRIFADTSCTVTARSAAVLLGEPHRAPQAFLNAVPLTAQQIVEDVLQFTGVGLDWRITDWLVPAGAWSYTGAPLAAVRRVADAVGAVLACARAAPTLIVAPRYPVLPWAWSAATPDVVIALDAVELEGAEDDDRAPAEGVYISGQQQGVLALVKRTGTGPASDRLLPLVTDPLITHLDAARQRGEALLGAAGRRQEMTLSIPVLTGEGQPGVIDPGELVSVPDPAGAWRGLVRGVNIAGQGPDVMQTLTVERHL